MQKLTDDELIAGLRDAVRRCSERMGGDKSVPFFSIPADPRRDVDLLMSEAAERLERLSDGPATGAGVTYDDDSVVPPCLQHGNPAPTPGADDVERVARAIAEQVYGFGGATTLAHYSSPDIEERHREIARVAIASLPGMRGQA